MRTHLLAAILILTFVSAGFAQRSPRAQASPPVRGVNGELLPRGDSVEAVLGGQNTSLFAPPVQLNRRIAPGVYELAFDDPGTGWKETVLLGVPEQPLSPAPLLVAFHGYGNTEKDILFNTSFFDDARARGWFVLAPLGAHKFNFGLPYAQQNVTYVLDWLLAVAEIDRHRIYGVGFSMGGGWALSYAARHLDPTRAMFAAVVNHTGTCSVSHVWWSSANPSMLELPEMFGGTPLTVPFAYQRVSSIDLDPSEVTVDPTTDMARNLAHLATRTWHATQDPVTHLVTQSQSLHGWLTLGGQDTQIVEVPSNQHSWSTLDETAVLDELEQHVLSIPTTGTRRLLADRNGRYLFFEVKQAASGAFSAWRYHLEPGQNRVILDKSQNLQRLTFHPGHAGLDTAQTLTVTLGPSSLPYQQIVLSGYPQAPQYVLRGSESSANWVHDPALGTVTLFEGNLVQYTGWHIEP